MSCTPAFVPPPLTLQYPYSSPVTASVVKEADGRSLIVPINNVYTSSATAPNSYPVVTLDNDRQILPHFYYFPQPKSFPIPLPYLYIPPGTHTLTAQYTPTIISSVTYDFEPNRVYFVITSGSLLLQTTYPIVINVYEIPICKTSEAGSFFTFIQAAAGAGTVSVSLNGDTVLPSVDYLTSATVPITAGIYTIIVDSGSTPLVDVSGVYLNIGTTYVYVLTGTPAIPSPPTGVCPVPATWGLISFPNELVKCCKSK